MKKTLTLFAVLLLAGATHSAFAQSDKKKDKPLLDSETYITEVTPVATDNKPPSKGKPDEMSFKNGKFKSDYFDEKGNFKQSSYTVTKDSIDSDEDRYIEFETVMKTDAEDELEIKGTVIGYDIEGTAKWSKNGKVKKEYSFAGGIKKGK